MLKARREGVVRRSKGAEHTFSRGVFPANAQRAHSLPQKPLQTMPNRAYILQRLTYFVFPGTAQSSSGFCSKYTMYCPYCKGLCLGSDSSEHNITPSACQLQNLGPTLLIPFPALFLVAAKGRCFQIPPLQNKAKEFLVLHGTHCTSQLASFINGTKTSQTSMATSHQQA